MITAPHSRDAAKSLASLVAESWNGGVCLKGVCQHQRAGASRYRFVTSQNQSEIVKILDSARRLKYTHAFIPSMPSRLRRVTFPASVCP